MAGLDRIDDKFFLERHVDSAAKLATKTLILEILTGMELEVVLGLIQGDLPEQARDDLLTYFDNESRVGDDIPAIYANYIVGADGRAPTKADVAEILDAIEVYVDRSNAQSRLLASQVDALYSTRCQYKYTKEHSWCVAHTKFITAMRERIDSAAKLATKALIG